MDYQLKTYSDENIDKSSTTACSESVTEPSECIENSRNPSLLPPPNKWARSLLCLLDDINGIQLFQQFLKQEGQDKCLSFWFACRGVKRHDPNDRDGLVKIINIVFEKKVKRISSISADTKKEIKKKLASNTDVNNTIFDTAQQEVESYMMETIYPKFLNSDLYIQHLSGSHKEVQEEKKCVVSPEPANLSPAVREDYGSCKASNIKIPLTKQKLLLRSKVSSVKQESPAGSPDGMVNNFHSTSFLPASAQDSELQSRSSEVQSDYKKPVTDGSSMDYPICNQSKHKHQQKITEGNAISNDDRLSRETFTPQTEHSPQSEKLEDPSIFHAKVVEMLNKYQEEQRRKNTLNSLEITECSKPGVSGLLYGPCEENCQEILDQHISRVFDSRQHTRTLSSGCLSPPQTRQSADALKRSCVPLQGLVSCELPQDVSIRTTYEHSQMPQQFTVPNSIKHRKDYDTDSTDSAINDSLSSSFRSQHSCLRNTKFLKCSKDHSKRYASKKFPLMTSNSSSSSSLVDSGISLAGESDQLYSSNSNRNIDAYKTQTGTPELCCQWSDQEQSMPPLSFTNRTSYLIENHRRLKDENRATFKQNSNRKANAYNAQTGTPELCCQWSDQEQSMPPLPFTNRTSYLIENHRRLKDENRTTFKQKCASGGRNSHETSRNRYKDYDLRDELYHQKVIRKSCPVPAFKSTPICDTANDFTWIYYNYSDYSVPYRSRVPCRNITLRQFKSILSRNGNFRYFFKTATNDVDVGFVFEEVTSDNEVLPMWEGKVFCNIDSGHGQIRLSKRPASRESVNSSLLYCNI